MENQLSSWKVSSEGSKTVVVLRLTALTSMAEHNTHTVQQYRRKPPSQQNRDKKRAEEHSKRFSQQKERQMDGLKNQQASDFIDFGFELFKKTPEPCAHEHEYRDVHNTSQHEVFPPCLDMHEAATGVFARATFRDKDKNTQLHSGEYQYSVVEDKCVDTEAPGFPTVDPRSGIPTEGEPTDSSTQNTPTAAMTPTERKAREEGFCIEKVKEQVGCVMDRLDQRWLRDRNRNKSFVKIVADTRNNGEILIAESEDFIFLYNNKSKTLDHWWMKRGRKAVTERERGVIGPLNWWPPVSRDQYRDACSFLEHRLNTVADLVREYMG